MKSLPPVNLLTAFWIVCFHCKSTFALIRFFLSTHYWIPFLSLQFWARLSCCPQRTLWGSHWKGAMFLYNLTLQRATGITHAIHGNFSGELVQDTTVFPLVHILFSGLLRFVVCLTILMFICFPNVCFCVHFAGFWPVLLFVAQACSS